MRKGATLALAALCSLLLAAQDNNPLINSGEWIQKGIELHDQKKYKEAINCFAKVERGDTNYYQALYEMAYSFSSDSQYTKALELCTLGLKSPNEYWPQLYTLYGNLLDDAGQPERALRIYDSAIALYPAFTSLRLNKGTTYLIQKKYKEAEAVFKECIIINPYETSAHYKLGTAAFSQGKIMEAFLSFINYMLLQPNGRFQQTCIRQMSDICKNTDNIQELINARNDDSEMPFALVEKIVLSKIALDKNFKPLIKLDDPVTRQIQVTLEKLEYDEKSENFWMQYYVPLFKAIFQENKFEPFIYRVFSGLNIETIQTYVKKNKDEQQAMVDYLVAYYNQIRTTRELNYSKRLRQPALYHFENGKLYGKGNTTANGEKFTGDWEFYYNSGNLRSIGKFNSNGEKEGEWKYYHYNGVLRSKQIFRNDIKEGLEIFYFDNGVLSSELLVKNGKANGKNTTYYIAGSPRVEQDFKDGQLEGIRKTFYSGGNIRVIETYKTDTLHGPYTYYFNSGSIQSTGHYNHGEPDGPFKSYHSNGKVMTEGQYKNGKVEGLLKRYHQNGQLKSQENYINGELDGEYAEYYNNGALYYKSIFKKGKQVGVVEYFDRDNKRFCVYNFDNSLLKSAKFFDKSGKEIGTSERKSKKLDLISYSPDGFKRTQAAYNDKGQAEGVEITYYNSGQISSEINYEDGVQNGRTTYYYSNGNKSTEVDYVDGNKHGYQRSWYMHGQLESEGWYQEDVKQGIWYEYDELGILKAKTTYRDDEMDGYREEYFPNGKINNTATYNLGWIESFVQYDTTGKEINRCEFKSGNGKLKSVLINGKLAAEGEYKYGDLEGAYKVYYPNGKIGTLQFYKRGLLDSIMRSYYTNGKIATEGVYKLGERTGTWKHYLESGKLEYTETYSDGELHGKKTYLHENGKLDSETEYVEGNRHGWLKKYDENGGLLYQVKFELDLPVAYTYPDKSGKLLPEIAIPGGSGKVKTYFADGKPSADFDYKDGLLNGPHLIYFTNGKPRKQSTEDHNQTNGVYKYYHPNGQVELDYFFLHDKFHNMVKIYNDKGILLQDGYYHNGSPHGQYKIFDDTGKLKEVKQYYYGDLLEIKTN